MLVLLRSSSAKVLMWELRNGWKDAIYKSQSEPGNLKILIFLTSESCICRPIERGKILLE